MSSIEEKKKAVEILIKNNFLVDKTILEKLEDEAILANILKLDENTDESKIRELIFPKQKSTVKIIKSYKEEGRKRAVGDFVSHFNTRYTKIKEILQKKQNMQDAISIKRIEGKTEREPVTIIGMIYERSVTKNENIMFTVEDPTGRTKVLVNKNKQDIYNIAKDCVCDEVIGVSGVTGDKIIFADNITLPDVPPTNELKKGPEDIYVVFTGDQHVGAEKFLDEKFENFLKWMNGEVGDEEQKEIAKKVKYLFLVGDLIDGIGIHPRQYEELNIKSVEGQYEKLAEYLKKIPSHIEIILCAGNHDALRLIEPQPPLYKDYAQSLYDMPNTHLVSNPSVINIGSTETFRGFNVLLYHGMSFHFFSEHVDSISREGGQTRADLIMQFLLQRRHLAPEHGSVTSSPRIDEDPLLIDIIPDFFVTGHIHRASLGDYRNITLLNCSCWLGMTSFQEKVGLVPEPGRAFAVNLRTRETKVMKF